VNNLAHFFMSAILIGLGATLTFDLWALFLKHAFRVAPSNICLVGRWISYLPKGGFRHESIAATPQRRAECAVGWIAHYLIGTSFAIVFVAFAGDRWLQHPTLVPALVFGLVTVVAPFLIMQPSFGLGIAASKTSDPAQARLRSLMNHAAFGTGLFASATLLNMLIG
jgi:hypothetical protein